MKPLLLTLFFMLLALCKAVSAEPVVVVNAASAISGLSQDDVTNIFLGRYRRLPNGGTAVPIDQPESSPLRAEFYRRLVNKDLNEVNAYWARLIFSGKTSPPLQAANSAETISLLVGSTSSIGYIDRSQLDKRFRIVLEFPR
ncbi:MAG: phosphate ABC transporter substrate-binding protein [Rhodoferax sp.]|uniref:phosphate ABC transporter substrate-binding protein n=1 Tax=Rhodoferax sp. TaxID=50421 RepID=UPI00260993AB|nr:phosphate ABC transporter substrate-binding protein [Rhodoferax sp.]MDD2879307.1 phosphate ABC transporter substrate-binding protein [Rhodoferax sp.]